MDTSRISAILRVCVCLIAAILSSAGCGRDSTGRDIVANEVKSICPGGKATETDGYRRLALIVGVGEYEADKVPDLPGPPNDAQRMYDLLTGDIFRFPKENVCLLVNEDATTAAVKSAFDEALVKRADDSDIAVFYYAGHGSQAKDLNGDEPADELDETFLFHDARVKTAAGKIRDMRDDEFNGMLTRLHAKTENIVVILDSCNSGTATRDGSGQIARFFEPDTDVDDNVSAATSGDGGDAWTPDVMPGLVAMTAASDGTPAIEAHGKGIFTDALIQVLQQGSGGPVTYAQLSREVPLIVRASSYQITYFQGDLNRAVFGNTGRTRPLGWDVVDVGVPVKLAGPPLAGIGTGAELRVYDGAATASVSRDPTQAKATLTVTDFSGITADATITSAPPDASPIRPGDLAVVTRPAVAALKVRIRPPNEQGGIPVERAAAIRNSITSDADLAGLIEIAGSGEDFELTTGSDDSLILWGPERTVRNRYERDADVPYSLGLHAKQRTLLNLHGEGGADFEDNQTLKVRLVPAKRQTECARDGVWHQAQANSKQVIPLCYRWNIEVSLSEESRVPLAVGGVILSTDGSIFGFPADGRMELLPPGKTLTLNSRGETFQAQPPLDVEDLVIVFGTQEENPVAWHQLTARTRGAASNALERALYTYVNRPGSRGVGAGDVDTDDTKTWTRSVVPVRVEANTRFLRPADDAQSIDTREYTVANFDIRPYLPDDESSALYKVLITADALAKASGRDGYSYKQHDWSKPTDAENLAVGIDCSRAIWYAFTRSGLPYNARENAYLTTADMVTPRTAMADSFSQCPTNGDYRLGDILVYRSDERGDGHVVMVIDAPKRIAWGSHGWDGSPRFSDLPIDPDTGVEYQKIKVKKDWRRWDRGDMQLKACWRYRSFEEEAASGRGLPGIKAIETPCDPRACRLDSS